MYFYGFHVEGKKLHIIQFSQLEGQAVWRVCVLLAVGS